MRPVVTCAIEYPDEEIERKALRSVVLQKEFTDDPELAMQKPEQMIAQGVHFQVHVHKSEPGPCLVTLVVSYWIAAHLLLLCAFYSSAALQVPVMSFCSTKAQQSAFTLS